ncbi:pectinesterase family protein [Arenimonas sp.]|uniref:pectinesterase family protein n=1 Tax=Arenimonas sp. TaxID=1872635 RepID=UPI0039E62AB7
MQRRDFLIMAGLAVAVGATKVRAAATMADAYVGPGGHASLSSALRAAPGDASRPYRIAIAPGLWRGQVRIDKPNIHLIGSGRDASVIAFGASAGDRREDGSTLGTAASATVTVVAPGFHAYRLGIHNDFDYATALAAGAAQDGAQAVALRLAGNSDRCLLRDVALLSHQDTFYPDAGRCLLRHCLVAGSVDFIFGAGCAWFEQCELRSRHRPAQARQGWLVAPSTPISQAAGLVFDRCRLRADAGMPANSVALGRAWRPTRDFADGRYGDPQATGQAVFLDCWMDAHIDRAQGWDAMRYRSRSGERIDLSPEHARLYEYGSRGPGAARSPNRRWLSPAQAAEFRREVVLGDWREAA